MKSISKYFLRKIEIIAKTYEHSFWKKKNPLSFIQRRFLGTALFALLKIPKLLLFLTIYLDFRRDMK